LAMPVSLAATIHQYLPLSDGLPVIRTRLPGVIERRMRGPIAQAPPEMRVTEVNETARTLFAQAGISLARGRSRMEIKMHEPPPSPRWPQGSCLRPCILPQDTRRAFQDECRSTPEDLGA